MYDDQQPALEGTVDRGSPLPLYYQLKQILLRSIESGKLAVGQALPSEREFEARYNLSRITVRRALSDLTSEGYICRQSGRGTFVLPYKVQDSSGKLGGLFSDLAEQGFEVHTEVLEYDWRQPTQDIAERLGITEGESVFFLKRLIYGNGQPLSTASGYFRLGLHVTFTKEELASDSIFTLVEQKYGIHWPSAEKTLEAVGISAEDAVLLGIRPGAPVLLSKVLVYDQMGKPTGFFVAVYRSDRYKYHCTLSR